MARVTAVVPDELVRRISRQGRQSGAAKAMQANICAEFDSMTRLKASEQRDGTAGGYGYMKLNYSRIAGSRYRRLGEEHKGGHAGTMFDQNDWANGQCRRESRISREAGYG